MTEHVTQQPAPFPHVQKLDGRMLAAIREKPTANEQEIQLEARIRTLQKRSAAGTIRIGRLAAILM